MLYSKSKLLEQKYSGDKANDKKSISERMILFFTRLFPLTAQANNKNLEVLATRSSWWEKRFVRLASLFSGDLWVAQVDNKGIQLVEACSNVTFGPAQSSKGKSKKDSSSDASSSSKWEIGNFLLHVFSSLASLLCSYTCITCIQVFKEPYPDLEKDRPEKLAPLDQLPVFIISENVVGKKLSDEEKRELVWFAEIKSQERKEAREKLLAAKENVGKAKAKKQDQGVDANDFNCEACETLDADNVYKFLEGVAVAVAQSLTPASATDDAALPGIEVQVDDNNNNDANDEEGQSRPKNSELDQAQREFEETYEYDVPAYLQATLQAWCDLAEVAMAPFECNDDDFSWTHSNTLAAVVCNWLKLVALLFIGVVLYALCFVGPGQLLTVRGRTNLMRVLDKYLSLFQVVLGVWDRESCNTYDLHSKVESYCRLDNSDLDSEYYRIHDEKTGDDERLSLAELSAHYEYQKTNPGHNPFRRSYDVLLRTIRNSYDGDRAAAVAALLGKRKMLTADKEFDAIDVVESFFRRSFRKKWVSEGEILELFERLQNLLGVDVNLLVSEGDLKDDPLVKDTYGEVTLSDGKTVVKPDFPRGVSSHTFVSAFIDAVVHANLQVLTEEQGKRRVESDRNEACADYSELIAGLISTRAILFQIGSSHYPRSSLSHAMCILLTSPSPALRLQCTPTPSSARRRLLQHLCRIHVGHPLVPHRRRPRGQGAREDSPRQPV